MIRASRLLLYAFLGLLIGACNQGVSNFSGARIAMTLANLAPTSTGEHVEVWARDGTQTVVRLNPTDTVAYAIVPVVTFDDPCMIDEHGHLLWKRDGQHNCFGRPCASPEEQDLVAQSVIRRIAQVSQLGQLLVLVAWDDAAAGPQRPPAPPGPPSLVDNLEAAERLRLCNVYWSSSSSAYSGNPFQFTAPVHGTYYGALDFLSISQIAGGIRLDTPFALRGIEELWLSQTSNAVNSCTTAPSSCVGPRLVEGNARFDIARGVTRFELLAPAGQNGSGTATVYTNLQEDPVIF